MKNLTLIFLAVVSLRLIAGGAPSEPVIKLQELPDEVILKCFKPHPRHSTERVLADVRGSYSLLNYPPAYIESEGGRRSIRAGVQESATYPVPFKMTGVTNLTLVVLAGAIEFPEANHCILGRRNGTIEVIASRRKGFGIESIDSVHEGRTEDWVEWLQGATPDEKYLLVNHRDTARATGGGPLVIYPYKLKMDTEQWTLESFPDAVIRRGETGRGFTKDGQFYYFDTEIATAPDNPSHFYNVYHFYVFKEGQFVETPYEQLSLNQTHKTGAIVSPNILPRELLKGLPPRNGTSDATVAEVCGVEQKGFQKFGIYIGLPKGVNLSSNPIKQGSIELFTAGTTAIPLSGRMNRISARPEVAQMPIINDNLGVGWAVDACHHRTLIPQMPLEQPVYCPEVGSSGQRIPVEMIYLEMPLCPTLKGLGELLRTSPNTEFLAVQVTGEFTDGDRFLSVAKIKLIPGTWDERFSGANATPGNR